MTFRIAVVVAHYGLDTIGGAETLARGFAEEAFRRGWSVEVWTSRARDPYTRRNELPPGKEIINGVVVRRFSVSDGDSVRFHSLVDQLRFRQTLSIHDQYEWLESGPQCPSLYYHLTLNAQEFDAIVVLPYLNPIAYHAAWSAPEKTVLWPCLHNEAYAYLEPFRLLVETVRGILFNSPEEADLALNTIGWQPRDSVVVGVGVNLNELDNLEASEDRDFLLYVGRLEHEKNLRLLYDFATRYYEEDRAFKCVLVGTGPLPPPSRPPFKSLGYVTENEKAELYKSALALCQPSENESFSLAIMESWLAGRPVIVSENCAVTAGHVARSKGGLWFRTYGDFAGAVSWLKQKPDMALRMGSNGYQYVIENYTWEKVVDRLSQAVTGWIESDNSARELY